MARGRIHDNIAITKRATANSLKLIFFFIKFWVQPHFLFHTYLGRIQTYFGLTFCG